jgi:GTPase
MPLKKIAIVGRPNVGKSSLFNAICKKRISIVDEAEGITRDRLYSTTDFFGFPFEIIDTGGIQIKLIGEFSKEIRQQAEIAICEADSIIMVVDAQVGPHDLDYEIARILHREKKPLCLAVNKVDNDNHMNLVHQFSCLGIPKMVPVSASHAYQIAELLEVALEPFDKTVIPELPSAVPHITILGRPNVGKSALLNALLGEERSIVSPIAGTTRDSIDTLVKWEGEEFLFIDTAGIRRRHKEKETVDKYAHIRSERALERADIVLLVMDSTQGMTTEEKKIVKMIENAEKGCILLFNKWDLAKGFRMEHAFQALEQEIPFFSHCPKLFISAKTKRNLDKIFPMIKQVKSAYETRIPTHPLNKNLISAMQKYHPPVIGGKRLRIYYMAQIDTKPPRFVLFVNNPLLMEEGYKRYLINNMREAFDFTGTPLLLSLKGKEKTKRRPQKGPREFSSRDRDLPDMDKIADDSPNDYSDNDDSDDDIDEE